MAILVRCDCGRSLRVRDELAGRRVRCPDCDEPVEVPEESSRAVPARKSPVARPEPPAGTIRFRCDCGELLVVKRALAGRWIDCPGCDESLRVPADEEDDREERGRRDRIQAGAPARRRPALRDEPDEDEEEEDRPRPARKRGRSNRKQKQARAVWPFIAAGVAALLLVAGGAAGLFFYLRASRSNPATLAGARNSGLLPANGVGFISIRLADLWGADPTKRAVAALPPEAGNLSVEMEKSTGLTPSDIERVTLVFPEDSSSSASADSLWAIVTTVKPYDRSKLLGKLNSPKQEKHEGRTYHAFLPDKGAQPGGMPGPGGMPRPGASALRTALYFHDSRTLVVGPEAGVKKALAALARPVKTGPLAEAVSLASGKEHIVAAFRVPPKELDKARAEANQNPDTKALLPLLDMQTTVVSLNVGSTLEATVTLIFADEAKARQGKAAVDQGITWLKTERTKAQKEAAGKGPELKEVWDLTDKVLASVEAKQSGKQVSVRIKMETNDLVNAVKSVGNALGGKGDAAPPPFPGRPGGP
jgi:hypothetical protein